MKNPKEDEFNKLLYDVERYHAERKKSKKKITFMRNKIVELGATKRKTFVPFKEGLKNKAKKEEERRQRRLDLANDGLFRRKKKMKSKR